MAEHLENKPAERIKWLIEHIKDKDDRRKQDQQQNYQAHQQLYGQSTSSSYPPPLADNLDDEIPFEIRIYLNLAKIDRTLTKSAAQNQQKTAQTGG